MAYKKTSLIAGNWKMNGLKKSLVEIDTLDKQILTHNLTKKIDVEIAFFLPATLICAAACKSRENIQFGGQDCHSNDFGPFTGDISAFQLKDCGAEWVLVGHSERRQNHHETNQIICKKIEAALRANLKILVCIGEPFSVYKKKETISFLKTQLAESLPATIDTSLLSVAYEPIWAIGSGDTPSLQEIEKVHSECCDFLIQRFGDSANKIRLLYGGSVTAGNAEKILNTPYVDGVLVGGASLKADDFFKIFSSCSSS